MESTVRLLLFATTALDFYLGRKIAQEQNPATAQGLADRQRRVEPEHAGIFQVRKFPAGKLQVALAPVGINYHPPHLDIFLPIGISFYTFHSLSYTLDVYRGATQPTQIAA